MTARPNNALRHGHWSGGRASRTYQAWAHAKNRCFNENDVRYARYGGRGIGMCERWVSSFDAFLEDMGEAPVGRSLDRKNNHEGYSKDNCRWATRAEQARNTSKNVVNMATAQAIRLRRIDGLSLSAIATEFEVSKSAVHRIVTNKTWANNE